MMWPFLLKHRADEKGVCGMKKVLVAAGVLAALVAAGVVVLKKSGVLDLDFEKDDAFF